MRARDALAISAVTAVAAAGCAIFEHDSIVGWDEFAARICHDTTVGVDEIVTGTGFSTPASNTDAVTIKNVEVPHADGLEVRGAYVAPDGSLSGGAVATEDLDSVPGVVAAEGVVIEPGQEDFSIAVDVKAVDPDVAVRLTIIRVTYADANGRVHTVDGPTDYTLSPGCLAEEDPEA